MTVASEGVAEFYQRQSVFWVRKEEMLLHHWAAANQGPLRQPQVSETIGNGQHAF